TGRQSMVAIYVDHALSDDARRRLLFGGALLLNSRSKATVALSNYASSMIVEAFAPHAPETAQDAMLVQEFVERVAPLKKAFTNGPRTKELIRDMLSDAGCDLADTYFDVPRMRVVPHGGYLNAGVAYAYKPHRDTWYAAPLAQINWWMPIYAVTPERAMSFFPEYWDKALRNSSCDFDYDEWCAVGRPGAVSQITTDTRKHPLPLEEVSTASDLRIGGMPGDMIRFSGSHLHSTFPNVSGVTRFSADFRTVSLEDLRTQRGAPNVDSRSVGSTLRDFISAKDFTSIPDV
ncbi:MAG TPA: hypothetical protein VK841_01275, partial [Polyangiaceae bacterium]|nr:hypothetical protein [Polyangiaceae bacterium]